MVQRALNVYSVHLVFRGISERLGKYCKESDMAVSYTHLTLPTILRV